MINVVGMTEDEAKKALDELNLLYEIKTEKSEEEEGTVIKQSVKEGASINEGAKIVLTVSAGEETKTLADYSGQKQDEAEKALKELGYTTKITTEYDDDVETGYVIRTNPAAKSEISKDTVIELIISRGRETKLVTVPTLVGSTEVDAREMCEEAGLEISVEYVENEANAGKVISQDPSSATNIEEGSTVSVIVGKAPETTTTEETTEPVSDEPDTENSEGNDSVTESTAENN